jgi:hypothetical protein
MRKKRRKKSGGRVVSPQEYRRWLAKSSRGGKKPKKRRSNKAAAKARVLALQERAKRWLAKHPETRTTPKVKLEQNPRPTYQAEGNHSTIAGSLVELDWNDLRKRGS